MTPDSHILSVSSKKEGPYTYKHTDKKLDGDCISNSPSPFVLPEHAVLDTRVPDRELARQIGASQQRRLDHGNGAIGIDVVHFV